MRKWVASFFKTEKNPDQLTAEQIEEFIQKEIDKRLEDELEKRLKQLGYHETVPVTEHINENVEEPSLTTSLGNRDAVEGKKTLATNSEEKEVLVTTSTSSIGPTKTMEKEWQEKKNLHVEFVITDEQNKASAQENNLKKQSVKEPRKKKAAKSEAPTAITSREALPITSQVNIDPLILKQNLIFIDQVTPLMRAAELGDVNQVRVLLSEAANPNECNRFAETPLIFALKSLKKGSFHEIVGLLLEAGANPNVTTTLGFTALDCAEARKDTQSVRLLIQHGAVPSKTQKRASSIKTTVKNTATPKTSSLGKSQANEQNKITSTEQIKGKFYPLTKEFENKYLSNTIAHLNHEIEFHTRPKYLSNFRNSNAADFDPEENYKHNRKANELRPLVNKPYFGRIDIQSNEQETYYIGETGIEDRVISWVSPAASLFYEKQMGPTFHKTLGNVDVDLIRQYEIENQEIVSIHEVAQFTDPMLEKTLTNKKGGSMANIVETIQAEQNRIIRLPQNANIIIQGSAGSGKTAIALHRLAYLFFSNKDLNMSRLAIFGPNELFLQHIKNVIPSLRVGQILQTSFYSFCTNILNEKEAEMENKNDIFEYDSVSKQVENHEQLQIIRLKGSTIYRNAINDFYQSLLETFSIEEDYRYETVLSEFVIGKDEIIEKIWLKKSRSLSRKIYLVEQHIEKQFTKWYLRTYDVIIIKKEEKKKFKNALKQYIKRNFTFSPVKLYRSFLTADNLVSFFPADFNDEPIEPMLQQITKDVNKPHHPFSKDDLAALLHFYMLLYGKQEKFQYVVIDEAQDYNPYEIWIINEFTAKNSLMLLGDLGQSIYSYRGMNRWEDFHEVIDKPEYYELENSYRSTQEIMNICNSIIASYSANRFRQSLPSVRSGKTPSLTSKQTMGELHQELIKLVRYKKQMYESIAILTRNADEAILLHELMESTLPVKLQLSDEKMGNLKGITILPIYLTKGIEFDLVVIFNANEQNFSMDEIDQKLLYVGCSRALHELHVFHNESISPHLKPSLLNKNFKINR